MGNFLSEELINEIKDANEIIDVISQYIQVKKVGSSYKALCPFHNEKTPSFIINQEKQIYKCFGCGEGGDVISFIMKMENLDFIESVKLLAGRANIEINRTESLENIKRRLKEKSLYYEINRKAGLYFYDNLTKQPNPALKYLSERGITSKTLTSFGLGYSMDSWDNLMLYLQKEGYNLDDIQKCGLIRSNKSDGYYDYFRNRIMFPIFNTKGDVTGFGGRVIDDSMPKYLNSPETLVFNKSNILYGLNFARKNIRNGQIILVEGYMDVIALHQADFKNAVASLGTSLTEYQGRLLKKYCDEIIICFDGDEAGTKATMRNLDILSKVDCRFRIMVLPDDRDPDDFIKLYGRDEFQEHIDKSMSLIDYKIFLTKNKYPGNTIEDRVGLAKEVSNIIKDIKSPVEREAYIEKIANETGISKESIRLEVLDKVKSTFVYKNNLKRGSDYKRSNNYIEMVPLAEQKGHIIAEKQLIKFMITDNKLIKHILNNVSAEDFSVTEHQEIVAYLASNMDNMKDKEIENLFPHLEENINKILSTDIEYIDLNNTLDKYIVNLKKYKLLYNIRILEEEQHNIVNSSNLTEEEVESKLLDIGIKIMKKNAQIQKLKSSMKGG
ncbi:MAG: DNA primase [Natronincolaceae bacterium]|jgi:DNA primase|nr:DNA primase [Bacillota bacterium]NLK90234.1 DNA primase [Clostridiales bacterium]